MLLELDPTEKLLAAARRRDPKGEYQIARAESLPFSDASFDLVVSYLTLIDIADFRAGLKEMARVLAPKGILLIARSSTASSPAARTGRIKDQQGRDLHYPVDRYLEEFPAWLAWLRYPGLSIGIARSPPTFESCSHKA